MEQSATAWGRLALLYGSALIVGFFSEFLFFNEGPAFSMIEAFENGTLILMLFELGVWYALALAPFLWIIEHFRVRDVWGLFLAGTAAGFFIEGLIIPVFYFELPFSLVWVSMSWHPLVCVVFGWWLYQRWLRKWNVWQVAGLNALLGFVWGSWATWPVGNETELTGEIMQYVPAETFTFFAFSATAMLLVGNILVDRFGSGSYQLSKMEAVILTLLTGGLFVLIVLSVGVLAFALVMVMFILWLGLRRNQKHSRAGETVIGALVPRVPFANHVAIVLMPITAPIAYQQMAAFNIILEAWIFAIPLSIAGVTMFVLSFWFLYQKPAH